MLASKMRPVQVIRLGQVLSSAGHAFQTLSPSEGRSVSLSYHRHTPVALLTMWWTRKYSTNSQEQHQNREEKPRDYFRPEEEPVASSDGDNEEEFQIRLKILAASLNHVNSKGWSSDALRAGAADLNLSESIASLCTPYELVEYFQRYSNHQLEQHLRGLEKKDKSLYNSMEYRLKQVVPFIDRYHQAMGLSLEPINIPRSLQVLRELSDIICVNGLGDTSTDLRWYTKRTGIISLYVATECCMVQDKSDNFEETWKFLERRVKDYEFCESTSSALIPVMESGVTTILNILGMNRRR